MFQPLAQPDPQPVPAPSPSEPRASRSKSTVLVALVASLPFLSCRPHSPPQPHTVRVATFNVQELSWLKISGDSALNESTKPLGESQLRAAAEIVARVRPDILVLQEVDVPPTAPWDRFARAFVDRYLTPIVPDHGLEHFFVAPSNTGIATGLDLDGDGIVAGQSEIGSRAYGNDAYGFGIYPGQYGMAVLARFPIDAEAARTFQKFLWNDLPGNHLPTSFYSTKAQSLLRLSSKSHWDVAVETPQGRLHLWVSHPTPPAFDGAEDRNGRRNFDEIRFWKLYLDGEPALYDDQGHHGGYAGNDPFVVLGDLNAKPKEPPVYDGINAIGQLLQHPRLQDSASLCSSRGAPEDSNGSPSDGKLSTAQFLAGSRVDYVVPSTNLVAISGGVFWPSADQDEAGAELAAEASDHRLVWLDVRFPDQH